MRRPSQDRPSGCGCSCPPSRGSWGARGARAGGRGRARARVGRTPRRAGACRVAPTPSSRGLSSCERDGPRRSWAGSIPRPSAAPGGHSPEARPTRGAGRPRATWPCEGRRPGPPASCLALPGLGRAFGLQEGPARRLPPLVSCTPLLPPLSPRVVVPGRAPSPAPATAAAAPTRADVELSLPLVRRVPSSLAEQRRKWL